jgi:hypothetical protein
MPTTKSQKGLSWALPNADRTLTPFRNKKGPSTLLSLLIKTMGYYIDEEQINTLLVCDSHSVFDLK